MSTDTAGTNEAIDFHRSEATRLREAVAKEKDKTKLAQVQELIDHHEAEVKNLRGSLG